MDRAELASDHGITLAHVMLTTGCAAAATAGRRRKRLYRRYAGPTYRRHAAVGAKRVPYRYQLLDRRHPVYADHDVVICRCRCSPTEC